MIRFLILALCLIGLPSIVHGAVRITEIAWMGTGESQFGEWIELYNDSDESVDLSGWKLYEAGGDTLVFTFTKSIQGRAYLVLERTTAGTPDPLPTINDEAGTFGGSGLANSGELLVLKDQTGETIQTLAFSGGWPAGDSESKQTMQWNGSSWVTASPTPKSVTSSSQENPPPSSGASTTTSSGGGSAWVPPKVEPRLELFIPKKLYTGLLHEYEAKTFLEYGEAYSGGFVWNMGDGTVYKSSTPKSIQHTYQYPGTYTISFGFYKNSYDTKPFFFETVEKVVSDTPVSLRVIPEKGFALTNTGSEPFDVSRWVIQLPDTTVTLPLLSIIAPKTTVIMPFSQLGVSSGYTHALLLTPEWRKLQADIVVRDPLPEATVSRSPSATVLPATSYNALETQETTISKREDAIEESSAPIQKDYTKTIFLGVALLVVIGLFLLLERFMAQKE